MRAAEPLLELMHRFLRGGLSATGFAAHFEEYFDSHCEEIEAEEGEAYGVLDDLRYPTVEYFQPDPKVREGEAYLLDEEQLRRAVQDAMERLEGLGCL